MVKREATFKVQEPQAEKVDAVRVPDKDKLGVWFFLGSEVILFGTLIFSEMIFRIAHPAQYDQFRTHLNIPLIALNTMVLVLSSYFVVRTLEAARHDQSRRALFELLVVIVLGAVFIAGQAFEWSTLFRLGVKLDSTFGPPFFILTGIHGLHVLIGIAWASLLLLFGLDRPFSRRRYRGVEIFGLYWHFVDIVWIVLFSVIYLL